MTSPLERYRAWEAEEGKAMRKLARLERQRPRPAPLKTDQRAETTQRATLAVMVGLMTAQEIADALGISRQNAQQRLTRLCKEKKVRRRRIKDRFHYQVQL